MNTAVTMTKPATAADTVTTDLSALKARQRGAWGSGDYAVVGTTLQILGENSARRSTCAPGRRC